MVSVKCGRGALTLRKWILNSFFMPPKYRIISTGSLPVIVPPSSHDPQHKHKPMLGLFAISRARLYPSKLEKMQRGTPASIGCGGASGGGPHLPPPPPAHRGTFL